MIILKLSFLLLSKTTSNLLSQLIDYSNLKVNFREGFSSRFQVFHISSFNTLPLLAQLDGISCTAAEVRDERPVEIDISV